MLQFEESFLTFFCHPNPPALVVDLGQALFFVNFLTVLLKGLLTPSGTGKIQQLRFYISWK